MAALGHNLIHSKIVVPKPATLLHRPKVCETIERGLTAKLTLLAAPAGYGKTSALVDFAHHCSLAVCWYTADERDRDLSIFVQYLIGAIQHRFGSFGTLALRALDALGGDVIRNPSAVAGELANDMLAVGEPFVLIVDNFEALDGAYGVREFIYRLLDVLPDNCHLMMGSRVLPEVPITRLVAKRQLVGLRDADLRFSPSEVQDLLQLAGIELSKTQAEAICERSEGWITGVLLLAGLVQSSASRFLSSGAPVNEETYAYLVTDVLERQPPDIQHFLHASAVLRELSARLCREILSIQEAAPLLAEVERRNLFITRFGAGEAVTYRYHNLFRDFLQQRLWEQDPERYVDLHRAAARWYERADDVEEAVYHYLAARSYTEASSLMERVVREWFWRGRVETLLGWAQALPEQAKSSVPWLLLYQSKVATDRLDYSSARQALDFAEAGALARGDQTCLASVRNQRATLALLQGRYEDAIKEAQSALEILAENDLAGQAEARRHIGRAYVGLGRFAEGIVELQAALGLFREIGSLYDVVNLLQDLTLASTSQGGISEAMEYLSEALAIARRLGAPALLAGVLNNLGMLHYDRGEYQEALRLYEEGLAVAHSGGDLRSHINILVGMADIYRDLGVYERADAYYNAAMQVARESRPGVAVYILMAQADASRWRDDYTGALAVIQQAEQLAEDKGLQFFLRGLLPVSKGIILAESGELENGIELLTQGVEWLDRHKARREVAKAHFLLAKARLLAGQRPLALAELREASRVVGEIGTDQFAVVEGQFVPALLEFGISENEPWCCQLMRKVKNLQSTADWIRYRDREAEGPTVGRLEIFAFGEGRVIRDGRLVTAAEWQAATVKEMFFYLLLHGPSERDAIGLVFFPDLSTKGMLDSFHTTLYRMRRALGSDIVTLEDGRYRIGDIDYWFDVREFERCVERARVLRPQDWQTETLWRRAVELYAGEFLPEVSRVWCLPFREKYHDMYIEALCGVAQCHIARADFSGAIEWYRRALAADELREDIHRRLIWCYAQAGRRAEAIEQYHRCREILYREHGIEPEPETKRLFHEIAGSRSPRSFPI